MRNNPEEYIGYFEDLFRASNAEFGPKDFFEIGSSMVLFLLNASFIAKKMADVQALPNLAVDGQADSLRQTRKSSLTLHAWASQPRAVWGASPSRISGKCPTQPVCSIRILWER